MSNKVVVYHGYLTGTGNTRSLPNVDSWRVGIFENHQQGSTKWWRRLPDSYNVFAMNPQAVFIDHEYGIPNLDDWHNAVHRQHPRQQLICYGINTFVDRTSPMSHLNPLCDLVNATKIHVSADLYPSDPEMNTSNGTNYRSRVQRRKDLLKYVQDTTKQMSYQVVSPVNGRAKGGYTDGVLYHSDWINEQVNNLDTTMGTVVFAAAGSDKARDIIDPAVMEMMRLVDAKYSQPTNTNGNGRFF
jgi:hypothetical protein